VDERRELEHPSRTCLPQRVRPNRSSANMLNPMAWTERETRCISAAGYDRNSNLRWLGVRGRRASSPDGQRSERLFAADEDQ
jgi:hypothetical protein